MFQKRSLYWCTSTFAVSQKFLEEKYLRRQTVEEIVEKSIHKQNDN